MNGFHFIMDDELNSLYFNGENTGQIFLYYNCRSSRKRYNENSPGATPYTSAVRNRPFF